MAAIPVRTSAQGALPLFRRAGLAGSFFLLVSVLLFLGPWPGENYRWMVADLGALVVDAFAVWAAWHRARTSPYANTRRAWVYLGVALALYLVADAVFGAYDFARVEIPYPSLADVFYVGAAVPAVIGLILFPSQGRSPVSRARLGADAVVLSAALALLSFTLVLRDLFTSLGTGIGAAVNVSYPLTDLLFTCLVGLLLLRGSGLRGRWDLIMVGLGFVSYSVADTVYGMIVLHGSYDSNLLSDTTYLAAPLLIGLGALVPAHLNARGDSQASKERFIGSVAPDVAVALALAVALGDGLRDWQGGLLFGLTLVLAVLRQVWLASENHRLRRDLERRVERRTAQVRELTLRYEHILESAGEGILGLDRDGRIGFVNDAGAALVGSSPEALVGMDACVGLHGPASGHRRKDCSLLRALRAEGRFRIEEVWRRGETETPIELTANPHQSLQDPAVVIVVRDVSERRAADRLKSEFVSVVSHELRTPLTSIHGALHLMADGDVGDLPPAALRMIDVAMRGTDRLGRLVNDILLMERLETGRLPLDRREHEADRLVVTVVSAITPVAEVEGVRLVTQTSGVKILVDADRFEQVLTNLVGNAVKFTPEGGEIHIDVRPRRKKAVVSVRDTGRGIAPELLEEVFDRFRQAEHADARVRGGSGLGLAISRALVQQMGGRIWVESEVGAGSTFRFTVPLGQMPNPQAVSPEVETVEAHGSAPEHEPGSAGEYSLITRPTGVGGDL